VPALVAAARAHPTRAGVAELARSERRLRGSRAWHAQLPGAAAPSGRRRLVITRRDVPRGVVCRTGGDHRLAWRRGGAASASRSADAPGCRANFLAFGGAFRGDAR
jgi:hypothetical protein